MNAASDGEWVFADEANRRWDDAGMIGFDCECGNKDIVADSTPRNLFKQTDDPEEWTVCDSCSRVYRVQPAQLLVWKPAAPSEPTPQQQP